MKIKSLFNLLFLFTLASCTNYIGGNAKISDCLTEKIVEFEKNAPCNDVSVSEYIFQGKIVYTFEPGTCGADMQSVVYSEDCVIIGYLGGFIGNTIVNGEDFSKAVFVKTVRKK
jgi:hypothetical protein